MFKNARVAAVSAMVLGFPGLALGQEREALELVGGPLDAAPNLGMVLDAEGDWRLPTIAEATALLRTSHAPDLTNRLIAPAVALLRQTLRPMSPVELEQLANAMGEVMLEDEEGRASSQVYYAFARALRDEGAGVPYPGAFDVLVRVYETRAERALADGGEHALDELELKLFTVRGEAGGKIAEQASLLRSALSDIFHAEPLGRGGDYVAEVFRSSSPPRDDCPSVIGVSSLEEAEALEEKWPCEKNGYTWCWAGYLLHESGTVNRGFGSLLSEAEAAEHRRHCNHTRPKWH